MTQKELDRLNELAEKLAENTEYLEYQNLLKMVGNEYSVTPEESFMGEYKGTKFFLQLPYKIVVKISANKYAFEKHGLNMIYKNERGSINCCQSLCNHDVSYFIKRMEQIIERIKENEKDEMLKN